jgi:hypothetical protein
MRANRAKATSSGGISAAAPMSFLPLHQVPQRRSRIGDPDPAKGRRDRDMTLKAHSRGRF